MMQMAAVAVFLGFPVVQAQEDPGNSRTAEARYTFAVKQAWTQTTYSERDLHPLTQEYLLKDVVPPVLRTPLAITSDPLLLQGTLHLEPGGRWTLLFDRIEYWDRSQRWWIEYGAGKIRTYELGGIQKWSGTPEEWRVRLSELERAFVKTYLEATAPQRPAPRKETVGLPGAGAQEPGRRLFVTNCLEEQGLAMVLARLNGIPRKDPLSPADFPEYPERVVGLAMSLLGRLTSQAAGEIAPPKARVINSRSIKGEVWRVQDAFVPCLAWPDGKAWTTEQARPLEEARKTLNTLSELSAQAGGIDEDVWRAAVAQQLKRLEEAFTLKPSDSLPTVKDALGPRLVTAGKGTYDFTEELKSEEERVTLSKVDIRGTLSEADVAFFHSGLNRWRVSRIRLETSYQGRVERKQAR